MIPILGALELLAQVGVVVVVPWLARRWILGLRTPRSAMVRALIALPVCAFLAFSTAVAMGYLDALVLHPPRSGSCGTPWFIFYFIGLGGGGVIGHTVVGLVAIGRANERDLMRPGIQAAPPER